MTDTATFSVFELPERATYNVRKTVATDANGYRCDGDRRPYYEGVARRVECSLAHLADILGKDDPPANFAFFTAGVAAETPATIDDEKGRTKARFRFPEGPGLLPIDVDALDELGLRTEADVVAALRAIGVNSDLVTSPSASSYLDWPKGAAGLRGLHVFAFIDKGTRVPQVLQALHARAWIYNLGRILIAQNGAMHARSIVDLAMKTSCQPIFEFGAVCADDFIRHTADRKVRLWKGEVRILCSDAVLLDDDEEAEYERLVKAAKEALEPKADVIKEKWLDDRVAHLPEADRPAARKRLRAECDNDKRTLTPDDCVTLNDGTRVTVRELLADTERFPHRMMLRDPFEPDYDTSKATLFREGQTDGRPKILSMAHGHSVVYFLEHRQPFPNPPLRDRPCGIVLDDETVLHGTPRVERPGLWWFDTVSSKDGPVPRQTWICDPLHIDAQTCDVAGNNYGRLLRFRTTTGAWREWAMPMAVVGEPRELVPALMSMGLGTDGSADGRQRMVQHLSSSRPEKKIRCVAQIGWVGKTFVLPDRNIGPDREGVVLQTSHIARLNAMHGTAGTIDGWRRGVAAVALGNPWLTLGLSVAFAGPLLERTENSSGGVHLVGDSSTGKSTILAAACSVWGGEKFVQAWRATANGLEGTAALSNHCLLALDEISQADPRHIGEVVYLIGNGAGKQRADRNGAPRTVTHHKTVVLSTGERTLADTMREGGKQVKAGQEVRLIDLRVGGAHGCFDELHGRPSGKAFVDDIDCARKAHYGHAGRAFLEGLVADERDLGARFAEIRALPGFNPAQADGQRGRVASRFALFALAGELASEYGVTGWAPGTATQAAIVAFERWNAARGNGNAEKQAAFQALRDFIDRHGSSRFSDIKAADADPKIFDRAGWWREVTNRAGEPEREYLFHASGFRAALAGFDFTGSLQALADTGVLTPAKSGGRQITVKVAGKATKVYAILPRKLDAAMDGERVDDETTPYDPFAT